jgi:hypothetical protein
MFCALFNFCNHFFFFALNIVLISIETALADFVLEINFLTTDFCCFKPVYDHFANNSEAKDLEDEALWYVTNYILNLFNLKNINLN